MGLLGGWAQPRRPSSQETRAPLDIKRCYYTALGLDLAGGFYRFKNHHYCTCRFTFPIASRTAKLERAAVRTQRKSVSIRLVVA